MSETQKLFNLMSEHTIVMARAYGLGSPESRAILTALESARVLAQQNFGVSLEAALVR